MRVYKPPQPLAAELPGPLVFLAGSIEMGGARNWQAELAAELADQSGTLLDPRRDEWDASWKQDIGEAPFRGQVEWELEGLERADLIAMWFEPATKSPITLLELGLHAQSGKLLVGCPEGFWRRGNIQVVCHRYAVPLVADWDGFRAAVRARLA